MKARYDANKISPSNDPCGTSVFVATEDDNEIAKLTQKYLPKK